jgi:hypothetical protein
MLARNWSIALYKFVNILQLPKETYSSKSSLVGAEFRKYSTEIRNVAGSLVLCKSVNI